MDTHRKSDIRLDFCRTGSIAVAVGRRVQTADKVEARLAVRGALGGASVGTGPAPRMETRHGSHREDQIESRHTRKVRLSVATGLESCHGHHASEG
jgi:hypothetical protein